MIAIENKEYNELEIQELIQEILQGHINSFEVIYSIYYKMVASIIRRIVKPTPHEIDGMINEAFLIVFKGLKGFKGDSKFSTYMYRIVLNYAFKLSKKKYKEQKHFVILGKNTEDFEENYIESIPSKENTEEELINKNIIENAIGTLSKDLQETVDLYYYERYSVKEIAKILNTTETAIKNRLYQARNKIKSKLKQGNNL